MPQLSQIDTFASQIFWMFLSFGILYFMVSKLFLPGLTGIITKRADIISSDILLAEKMKDEAAFITNEYNKLMAQVRAESNEAISQALKASSAEAHAEYAKLDAEISQQLSTAEAEINSSKKSNLQELEKTLVAELTQKITNELAGLNLSQQQIDEAVKSTK